MLCRDSDQNWIFYKFLKLLQNQVKVPTGSLAKFHQKLLGENSPFYTHSCTYVV